MERVDQLAEFLFIGILRIGAQAQLFFDAFEFFMQKVFALIFFNPRIQIGLNLPLDIQQFLFFFDMHKDLFHPFADVDRFQYFLLILFRDV